MRLSPTAFWLCALAVMLCAPLSARAASTASAISGTKPLSLSHDIHDYVQPGLRDLTLTLKTGRYDAQAGRKISKEFGMLYKLSGNGTFHYKASNLIRLDGKLYGFNGAFIMDGFTQHIRIGPIHKNQDESNSPGKVTTLLDFGLLNDFYLSYTEAQFQGEQALDGTPCAVFRLSYPARLHDTSFRLVWLDPRTRTLRKREEHGQDGALHAVYTFRQPVDVSGVWLPSEIDAANAQGEFVGQTFLVDARPNTGITEALFR
jgi:hypothetical protein